MWCEGCWVSSFSVFCGEGCGCPWWLVSVVWYVFCCGHRLWTIWVVLRVCFSFVVVWCPCWTENEYGGARTELPLTWVARGWTETVVVSTAARLQKFISPRAYALGNPRSYNQLVWSGIFSVSGKCRFIRLHEENELHLAWQGEEISCRDSPTSRDLRGNPVLASV